MTNNLLMSITYKRERDSKHITRQVEPYEIKKLDTGREYLYAYDRTGGMRNKIRVRSIKTFLLDNIISAHTQKRVFTSRYE